MGRYRAREVIDAVRFTGSGFIGPKWAKARRGGIDSVKVVPEGRKVSLQVVTLEGIRRIGVGGYLIRRGDGGLTVMSAQEFSDKYEEISGG